MYRICKHEYSVCFLFWCVCVWGGGAVVSLFCSRRHEAVAVKSYLIFSPFRRLVIRHLYYPGRICELDHGMDGRSRLNRNITPLLNVRSLLISAQYYSCVCFRFDSKISLLCSRRSTTLPVNRDNFKAKHADVSIPCWGVLKDTTPEQ